MISGWQNNISVNLNFYIWHRMGLHHVLGKFVNVTKVMLLCNWPTYNCIWYGFANSFFYIFSIVYKWFTYFAIDRHFNCVGCGFTNLGVLCFFIVYICKWYIYIWPVFELYLMWFSKFPCMHYEIWCCLFSLFSFLFCKYALTGVWNL